MKKGAIISACGKYRYSLHRIWDDSKPLVLWIMHNPSTADGENDDPTIRRIIKFSKDWGYGGLYVGNLSPYRSSDPNDLNSLSLSELQPYENYNYLRVMRWRCDLTVLAYGVPVKKLRGLQFNLNTCHYLKLTKEGFPSHPLYLKSDLTPIPYAN